MCVKRHFIQFNESCIGKRVVVLYYMYAYIDGFRDDIFIHFLHVAFMKSCRFSPPCLPCCFYDSVFL